MEEAGKTEKFYPYLICLLIAIIFFFSGYFFPLNYGSKEKKSAVIRQPGLNSTSSSAGELEGWIYAQVKKADKKRLVVEKVPGGEEIEVVIGDQTKFINLVDERDKTLEKEINKASFKAGDFINIYFNNSEAQKISFNPPPTSPEHSQ